MGFVVAEELIRTLGGEETIHVELTSSVSISPNFRPPPAATACPRFLGGLAPPDMLLDGGGLQK